MAAEVASLIPVSSHLLASTSVHPFRAHVLMPLLKVFVRTCVRSACSAKIAVGRLLTLGTFTVGLSYVFVRVCVRRREMGRRGIRRQGILSTREIVRARVCKYEDL